MKPRFPDEPMLDDYGDTITLKNCHDSYAHLFFDFPHTVPEEGNTKMVLDAAMCRELAGKLCQAADYLDYIEEERGDD